MVESTFNTVAPIPADSVMNVLPTCWNLPIVVPLDKAETAFHCKDWLYMKLTDFRATDPSEACFTFGDFRTRKYNDSNVIKTIILRLNKKV